MYQTAVGQIGPFIATFADPSKTGIELRDGKLVPYSSLSTTPSSSISSGSDDGESGYHGFPSSSDLMQETDEQKQSSRGTSGDTKGDVVEEEAEEEEVEGEEAECDYSRIPSGFVMPSESPPFQSRKVFEFKRTPVIGDDPSDESANAEDDYFMGYGENDHDASFIDGYAAWKPAERLLRNARL